MKKTLLFSLLVIVGNSLFAQTLDSVDFNALTLGNINEDITGNSPGQANLGVFATNGDAPSTTTNAAASNFQVVASGDDGTQGCQFISPDGDAGLRFLFKPFSTLWDERTPGNDIIEMEFSFFVDSSISSTAPFEMRFFGNDGPETAWLGGFSYDPQTRELVGLGRLNNGGDVGFFNINLGDLILPADTWINLGYSLDTATGGMIWKTALPDGTLLSNGSLIDPALNIPNMVPTEYDFLSFGVAGNTSAANFLIDNFGLNATSSDMLLLSIDEVVDTSINFVKLYPNPAQNKIKLDTNLSVNSVTIVNNLGQQVLNKEGLTNNLEFDISELKSGIYLMSIKTITGIEEIKRFIKN
ncbi:T9SS type A sorting domain-containing protein [Hyunsoonleella sp. 2307UL5-6]|uniref:T9SS type A sorting domain-containing protein n=1 Tax=Hyunsoonleella sp. 2307UL5-6 TaxID=3384768 RepID=UPI0039BCB1CE